MGMLLETLRDAFDQATERETFARNLIVAIVAGTVTGVLVAKLKRRV